MSAKSYSPSSRRQVTGLKLPPNAVRVVGEVRKGYKSARSHSRRGA